MTIGEERVRLTFNPSDNPLVTELKQKSAAMIDLCEKAKWPHSPDNDQAHANNEALRLWALAQTAYEEAAMWAVKAATA